MIPNHDIPLPPGARRVALRPGTGSILMASILMALLCLTAPTSAQEPAGDDLPPLDVENVTIVGTRAIRLPPARKAEVVDSSIYQLPAGDSLLFGERVSNFGGPGGMLPQYREFDPPATASIVGSFGTFLSPRARIHGELVRTPFDATATVEYMGTAGHTDSAEASSLLIDLRVGILLGGDEPTVPRVGIGAGFDRIDDSYMLYGSRATPYDRDRTATRISAVLQSAQDAAVDFDLYLNFAQSSIEDRMGDSAWEASANTPGFGLAVGLGTDTLRGRLSVAYQITSLRYGFSLPTPNFVRLAAEADYQPVPGLFLSGGVGYYGGQSSDSGSATLLTPRVSAHYTTVPASAGAPSLSLFAWFAPEMRPASYRDRAMRAPYVDRMIELRPERVPVSLTLGARYTTEWVSMEGRAIYEQGENTPVVTADTAAAGSLRWAHVESRTVGALVSVELQPFSRFTAGADFEVRSSTATGTDLQIPMVPQIDLRLRGMYLLGSALSFDAAATLLSSMTTTLGMATDRKLPSRFVIDVGGRYRLGERLEIFARATNLLSQEYQSWEGYDAPGLELRGGAVLGF